MCERPTTNKDGFAPEPAITPEILNLFAGVSLATPIEKRSPEKNEEEFIALKKARGMTY